MRRSTRLLILAALGFAAFLLLGYRVAPCCEPSALLPLERALDGHSMLIAWWFTWLGYAYVLAPLMLASIAVAFVRPEWRVRVALPIVSTLVAWQLADLFQRHFMRPRRADWFVKHEHAFSYPSSHAAIAVAFYLFWAAMVWRSELPGRVRAVASGVLGVLAAGIVWSRLALGAHYATDLAGGALLGASVVLTALAVKVVALPGTRA
jgi:undecaprenyl-diphosphatase